MRIVIPRTIAILALIASGLWVVSHDWETPESIARRCAEPVARAATGPTVQEIFEANGQDWREVIE